MAGFFPARPRILPKYAGFARAAGTRANRERGKGFYSFGQMVIMPTGQLAGINMLLRWGEKCRVGNEQIDLEHQFLFQLINEFYDAFAEKRERTLALQLLSRPVVPIVAQETLLGAYLQNKKNDGAKSVQPA